MPPPGSIAVLLNTRSGAAMARATLETDIADLLRAAAADVEIIVLRAGQDPVEAARDAARRASIVVAGGGDGTISAVAAGIAGTPAALGILPLGTLNHFARDLHIPFDLPRAAAIIAARRIGEVDVGEVNGSLFVNNSSIGLYPGIVEAREALRRQGHRTWTAMAMATARVLRRYRGVTVTIDVDGHPRTWRTPFVFVGNNEYEIDGIHLGERARLDQGRLFVYLAPRLRVYQLPVLLAKALVGRARRSGDFEIVPAAELWIGASRRRPLHVALDGEIRMLAAPLHYRSRPRALRVVVPEA